MILRSIRLGKGRIALSKTPSPVPIRSCRGYASSLERRERPEFAQPVLPQPQIVSAGSKRAIEVNDPDHPVAQDYLFYQHQKSLTADLGAKLTPHYKPHELVSNPPWPKDITLELLMASQSHLGHATSLWHPANAAYIFGVRGDHDPIHIISLDVTASHLRRACRIVSGVTESGGLVLFVGTRAQQSSAVVRAAQLAKGCHLFNRWTPGSITNGQQILGKCSKKVVNEFDEEVPGFEDQLSATAAIKPDLVVCLNPLENYVLLHECGINNIPTIGIIDTDANPTWVTYPIPANDDSLRCVQLIAGVLGRAGQEGQQKRLALAREGTVTYTQDHKLEPPKRTHSRQERKEKPQINAASVVIPDGVTPEAAQSSELLSNESSDTIDLVNDLDGVPVDQFAADEALLEEAERAAYLEEDEQQGQSFLDLDEDTSDSPSNIDAAQAARDLDAQFLFEDEVPSGVQTEHGTSPHSPSLDKDRSTWEQVESVEKELGENSQDSNSPPLGNPERGLDEEPGVPPVVDSPSQGAGRQDFGTQDDIEPKLEKEKSK